MARTWIRVILFSCEGSRLAHTQRILSLLFSFHNCDKPSKRTYTFAYATIVQTANKQRSFLLILPYASDVLSLQKKNKKQEALPQHSVRRLYIFSFRLAFIFTENRIIKTTENRRAALTSAVYDVCAFCLCFSFGTQHKTHMKRIVSLIAWFGKHQDTAVSFFVVVFFFPKVLLLFILFRLLSSTCFRYRFLRTGRLSCFGRLLFLSDGFGLQVCVEQNFQEVA